MTDELHPDDPLFRAADALRRHAPPVAPGLPGRVAVRRVRRRRQRTGFAVLAGALLLSVVVYRGSRPGAGEDPVLIAAAATPAVAERTFAFDAPESHSVTLVGDFTNWEPDSLPMRASADGKWEVTVAIPPGRYRYAFVVDNSEWRADPDAIQIPDDFGRATSVLTIPSDQDP